MEPFEWTEWQALNTTRLRGLGVRSVARPCDDCPLGYAAEMRAVGRCNGTPGGVEEDEVTERPQLVTVGRELPVALALPCPRCAHAPVCSIRAVMEARLESLPVTLPTLDPAITVSLSADVECGHFLRAKGAIAPAVPLRTKSPETRARMAAAQRARAERLRAEREASA